MPDVGVLVLFPGEHIWLINAPKTILLEQFLDIVFMTSGHVHT